MGDHGYQDVINEVDALCDLFLHACFSALASSPMDIQHFQGLATLPIHLRSMYVFHYHQIPQLLHVPSTCEPWQKCPGQPWTYHSSELGGDDSGLRLQFYRDCLRILCDETTYKAFERFMHNPRRSREFYASPQLRHGRIAEICLRELVLAAEYCILLHFNGGLIESRFIDLPGGRGTTREHTGPTIFYNHSLATKGYERS